MPDKIETQSFIPEIYPPFLLLSTAGEIFEIIRTGSKNSTKVNVQKY